MNSPSLVASSPIDSSPQGSPILTMRSKSDNSKLPPLPALEELLQNPSNISSYFDKLTLSKSNTTTNINTQEWSRRFFVFDTVEANLFIFRSHTTTRPAITFLPVVECTGSLDTLQLRISGHGISPTDGSVIRRTWTLQCPDEELFAVWLGTIKRTLLNLYFTLARVPLKRSNSSSISASTRSLGASKPSSHMDHAGRSKSQDWVRSSRSSESLRSGSARNGMALLEAHQMEREFMELQNAKKGVEKAYGFKKWFGF